jgi:O-antigen/teichoic acid export membrane protein
VLAPVATLLYGNQYGHETTDILRLLLIGLIPEAIVILYESVARIQAKTERVALINGSQAVLTIGLAAALSGPFGLAGIGIAWIVGHTVTAIVVLPPLLRLMFPRGGGKAAEAQSESIASTG